MFDRIIHFFQEGLWHIPYDPRRRFRSFFLKLLRIVTAAIRGISKDECFLKASALTYYSLLSIVPLFAVAFGIAKGFGFDQVLQHEVITYWKDQPEFAQRILDFTYSMLEQTKSGLIAGIGVVILFWTVLRLIESIEATLNDIWKVGASRNYLRKLTDYLALIILCPIVFAISSSLTIYITTLIANVSKQVNLFDEYATLIYFSFHIFPMLLACALFSFIYIFLPNTKVSWKAGILAGILAGVTYYILQWIYIRFQIGVSSYGAVYGSFAAIPLFLIWLNLSWLVLLMGAEIAYQIQENEEWVFLPEGKDPTNLVKSSRQMIALLIVYYAIKNFKENAPPLHARDFARMIGISYQLAINIIEPLRKAGIFTEIAGQEGSYQPGRDINNIDLKIVCDAVDDSAHDTLLISSADPYHQLRELLSDYESKAAEINQNISLGKLLRGLDNPTQ